MIKVFIDDIEIPESDIKKISEPAIEKLKFNFNNLISATLTIELSNVYPEKYDEEIENSFFGQRNWYNMNIKLYDTDTELYIWDGRIKNIKKSDSNHILKIESNNYIKEIVETTCYVNMGLLNDVTPSDLIKHLIVNVCNIPESAVNSVSFDQAKGVQTANDCYIIANYSADGNIKVGAVINEILRITSSSLFTINNILYYSQFELYDGDPYKLIDESMILKGSYDAEYDSENIVNDYRIAYRVDENNVGFAVPSSTPDYITNSISNHGERRFSVPNEDIGDNPSSYRLLLKNYDSAKFCGDLKREANHFIKKICKFKVKDDIDDLYLNTNIDFSYKHLSREPMRIIERKVQPKNKTIDIKAEMLNFPFAIIDRDKTPPPPTYIVQVREGLQNSVEVLWTPSDDPQLREYILYFSRSTTDMEGEFCDQGHSPLTIQNPELKEGLASITLTGLVQGAIYYFRIEVVDKALNVSLPSNLVSFTIPPIMNLPLFKSAVVYRTDGNIYDGVYLSASGITYEDYYLPSRDELNAIYNNIHLENLGNFENVEYWSSSEKDASNAIAIDFNNGDINTSLKSSTARVRPIRHFIADAGTFQIKDTISYYTQTAGIAGGIIFHIEEIGNNKSKYYEVPIKDYIEGETTVFQWSDLNKEIKLTETSIGRGYQNTKHIINQDESTKFDDWFLPSEEEVQKMRVNLYNHGVGDFDPDVVLWYWTSTETIRIRLDTSDGSPASRHKSDEYRVRAVRSFMSQTQDYELRDVGPAGGLIFHMQFEGNYIRYFEADKADIEEDGNYNFEWSNVYTPAIGYTKSEIGWGMYNTLAIINQDGHTISAASRCADIEYGETIKSENSAALKAKNFIDVALDQIPPEEFMPVELYTTYDSANYDSLNYSFTGFYLSEYVGFNPGINKFTLVTDKPDKYYNVEYRSFDLENQIHSNWEHVPGNSSYGQYRFTKENIDPTKVIQFRICFKPKDYTDDYKIKLESIE